MHLGTGLRLGLLRRIFAELRAKGVLCLRRFFAGYLTTFAEIRGLGLPSVWTHHVEEGCFSQNRLLSTYLL